MTSGCEATSPSGLQQLIRNSLPAFSHSARRRWKRSLMPHLVHVPRIAGSGVFLLASPDTEVVGWQSRG